MSYFILPRSLDIYYHCTLQRREGNPRDFQQLAKEFNVLLLDLGLEFLSLGFKVSTAHTGAHCSALRGSSKAVKFFKMLQLFGLVLCIVDESLGLRASTLM